MSSVYFERPHGFRDYLLQEYEKRYRLEEKIHDVFLAWGYDWLTTPLLEFEETIRQGLHKEEEEQLYRMFDSSGRTLVLRPEMTTPVARAVTTLLGDEPLPLHLAYIERTYRRVAARSNESSEVTQAGIELLGDATPDADAEVLAVMASVLQSVNVGHFRLAVGHTGFVGALLQDLPESIQQSLRLSLLRKDAVSYEQLLHQQKDLLTDREYEALLAMPRIRGGLDAIREAREHAIHPMAMKACDDLEALMDALGAHGLADVVQFDFGLYLEHDYYTGILFEGYVQSLGLPICFGGRYDRLLERFGRSLPATGGVLHLERLFTVMDRRETPAPRFLLFTGIEDRPLTYSFAQYLRQKGYAVRVVRKDGELPSESTMTAWIANGILNSQNEELRRYFQEFAAMKEEKSEC